MKVVNAILFVQIIIFLKLTCIKTESLIMTDSITYNFLLSCCSAFQSQKSQGYQFRSFRIERIQKKTWSILFFSLQAVSAAASVAVQTRKRSWRNRVKRSSLHFFSTIQGHCKDFSISLPQRYKVSISHVLNEICPTINFWCGRFFLIKLRRC